MPDEIFIAVESIGDDSPVSLDEGIGFLSPTECARAEAFRFRVHRERYVRGRALLRIKLGRFMDCSPESIVIGEEERGKPFVTDGDISFNLSHSQDLALLAVSHTLPRVGVDIELVGRDSDFDGLSNHYFSEGECREMRGLPAPQRRELFFKIWTAKEARMKLSGEGLHLDPREIDLEFSGGLPSGYRKPEPGGQFLHLLNYPHLGAVGSVVADQPFDVRPAG